MITIKPKAGDVYFYRAGNWAIISDNNDPVYNSVVVTTLTKQDIWYKVEDDNNVKTTSLERFMEIAISPRDMIRTPRGWRLANVSV